MTRAADRTARWSLGVAVALAVAVAAVARLVHGVLPASVAYPVGEIILAVVLGVVVAQLVALPPAVQSGLRRCVSVVLPTAIVLLGARLALDEVAATGLRALLIVAVLMVTAIAVAHVVGRLTGTPTVLAHLLGVGVSVCGNTAIIATAPAIGAKDEDVSVAIAVNTLFGLLAVIFYPLVGDAFGMSQAFFGTWAGTAVNDTSQVVAVGVSYGAEASDVATTVKLVRNTMLGLVVVSLALMHAQRTRGAAQPSTRTLLRRSFPTFVLGFVAMAVANTAGVLDAVSDSTDTDVVALCSSAASLLLVVALAAVGLTTSLAAVRRASWRPVVVGFVTATTTSLLSLGLIAVFGAAGG